MGNTAAIELEGAITKHYLKGEARQHVLTKRPELSNRITDKILSKSLIFIAGYIKCLTYHGVEPINTDEMRDLLTQECLDWIVEYIDKGGK